MELGVDRDTGSPQPLQGLGVGDGVKVVTFDENFLLRSRRQDQSRERHAMVTVGPHDACWASEFLPTCNRQSVRYGFGDETELSEEGNRPRQAIGLFVSRMRCSRDGSSTAHRHQSSERRDEIVRITKVKFGVLGR